MKENMKKTGIIAALELEMKLLKENLENAQTVRVPGQEFYTGQINGHEVVLMQCGMAKVSAAAGTQALISMFSPDCIINTGCAGALAPEIGIGDIVLSDSTVEWDIDLIKIGLPRGFVSAMSKVEMPADGALADLLEKAVPGGTKVYRGLVASGDQFVSENSQRELIRESFPGALCAEMEGGAVGHVCAQNKVPFCVLRCISDTADGNSGVDFAEFSKTAGEKSAKILLRMLGKE